MVLRQNDTGFKLLIIAVYLMQFGAAAGTIGVPILAKKVFQTSFWGLAMIGVIGAFVYSIVCFIMGGLVKKLDPYKMMVIGASVYAATFSMGIVADAMWHLILIYVVAGIAAAFYWPMVEAALVHGTTGEVQNRRIGVFNISWSLADALGTAAAGGLYLLWPRLPFVVLILTMALVLIITVVASRHVDKDDQTGAEASVKPSFSRQIDEGTRFNYARAAWISNFFAHGVTNVLRSVFTAPAVDIFKMSPLTIGLVVGTFNGIRTLTFAYLRRGTGWTYNPTVLTSANLLLATGMATIVGAAYFAPTDFATGVVFMAMVITGLGCGVIYYSSIYYSINLSHVVASHTRLHEAYLGAGAATLVLGSGGLHSLIASPSSTQMLLKCGLDQVMVSSLSPFILATVAVGGALAVSRRLFLRP